MCSTSGSRADLRLTMMEPQTPCAPNGGRARESSSWSLALSPGFRASRKPRSSNRPSPERRKSHGAVVHFQYSPARVELDDARTGGVEQLRKGRAQSARALQRLTDAHVLADMGQETPDQVEPGGRPVASVDRVVDAPKNARAARPVQADVDAVLGMHAATELVVQYGGLQFLFGEDVGNMTQLAVWELRYARDPLVKQVGIPRSTRAPDSRAPKSLVQEPRKVDLDVFPGVYVGGGQAVAAHAEGIVDQRGGSR